MVEAGDLIYDSDNERTYLVEAMDNHNPDMWIFLDLQENERIAFTESSINEAFDIGFWRFAKTS